MEAEEFTDQLFELIEREAFDPEGVEAFLAEHPEYRAHFDQLKASLAFSEELPLEEPSSGLDAAIFEIADARVASRATQSHSNAANGAGVGTQTEPEETTVVRLPVGRSWNSQPLAMAAVAMLVVGIGLATIGTPSGPAEGPVAVVEEPPADTSSDVSLPPTDEASPRREAGKVKPEPIDTVASAPAEPEVRRPKTEASPKDARKRSKAKQDDPVRIAEKVPAKEPDSSPSESPQGTQKAASESTEPLPSMNAKGSVTMPALAEGSAVGTGSACQKRVALFEKLMSSGSFKPSAQEQLDVGLCYKKLGKPKEARRWLEGASADPETRDRALKALETLE